MIEHVFILVSDTMRGYAVERIEPQMVHSYYWKDCFIHLGKSFQENKLFHVYCHSYQRENYPDAMVHKIAHTYLFGKQITINLRD